MTRCDRILAALNMGDVSNYDAMLIGGLDYRRRISDLRERGHNIVSIDPKVDGKPTLRYYRLNKAVQPELFGRMK